MRRHANQEEVPMSEVMKISAQEAREKTKAGQARLVCAYGDASKCENILLQGAESWPDIRGRLSQLDADQEMILYCA